MYEEAITNLQKAVELSGGEPGPLSALGYTYAVFGKRKEALKILHQLTLSNAAPDQIAHVYVGLGEKDQALDWLQKAVADHRLWPAALVYVSLGEKDLAFDCLQKYVADHKIGPTGLRARALDSIKSDRRYAELLRQTGLPP
jgi:tetratricopeptide (TPR) repeat protein